MIANHFCLDTNPCVNIGNVKMGIKYVENALKNKAYIIFTKTNVVQTDCTSGVHHVKAKGKNLP